MYQASVIDTGETVAIKKVLQDRRFKNRELDIMSTLDHSNVVCLKRTNTHMRTIAMSNNGLALRGDAVETGSGELELELTGFCPCVVFLQTASTLAVRRTMCI